ncbi:MAG: hypothetical protein LBU83_08625 [Bacteroidales bacterium]|jgi:hypothetical protein|nr:hypothetical protein [Bacteroidales bacterium]
MKRKQKSIEEQEQYKKEQYKKLNEKRALNKTCYIVGGVALFLIILTCFSAIWANYPNWQWQDIFTCLWAVWTDDPNWQRQDIFSTQATGGHQMNIPFAIFIQVVAVAGGIIIGLKIDNFMNAKKEKDESLKTLGYIKYFVEEISKIVHNDTTITEEKKKIFVLSEYKCHWEALLTGENLAFRAINDEELDGYKKGELYFELNYLFSFWEQNRAYWAPHCTKIFQEYMTSGQVGTDFKVQINLWEKKLEKLHKALQKTFW